MSSIPSTHIHMLGTSRRHSADQSLAPNGGMHSCCCKDDILVQDAKGARHLWPDGPMLEGDWREGKMRGKGKVNWPSGNTYKGELLAGFRHGFGTYRNRNGVYKGSWYMNEMHGFGRKTYANGDSYEGFWEQGVKQGTGRYMWKNGNAYLGEWKSGAMCGRGLMIWSCGCQYDGHFVDGVAHGSGVQTWANGDMYVGTWSRGLKDGRGRLFISPGEKCSSDGNVGISEDQMNSWAPQHERQAPADLSQEQHGSSPVDEIGRKRSITARFRRLSLGGSSTDTGSESSRDSNDEFEAWSVDEQHTADVQLEGAGSMCSSTMVENGAAAAVEVEVKYAKGRLIRERVKEKRQEGRGKWYGGWRRRLEMEEERHIKNSNSSRSRSRSRSLELLLTLQLGISTTTKMVAAATASSSPHGLQQQQQLLQEAIPVSGFGPKDRICVHFPKAASPSTLPHPSPDFQWKDYCPLVFRSLRELFHIGTVDYVHSICSSNSCLRELSSPGKSGSVFYLSHDDRFLIKTVRKSEVKVFLGMLRNYYHHVRRYPNTLITKFLGLHEIKTAGARKVYFVVMLYLFPRELRIHQRFDLKGSSQGRSATEDRARLMSKTCTLKDLDLKFVFRVGPKSQEDFLRQIDLDTKFLESENIMDYSLLLGVHFQGAESNSCGITTRGITDTLNGNADCEFACARELVQGATMEIGSMNKSSLSLQGMKLGWSMRARAERAEYTQENHALQKQHHHENAKEAYAVVLYVGIIDVLQKYNMVKRAEHAYKCLQYDALSISAVDPSHYRKRFQDFMSHIFLN